MPMRLHCGLNKIRRFQKRRTRPLDTEKVLAQHSGHVGSRNFPIPDKSFIYSTLGNIFFFFVSYFFAFVFFITQFDLKLPRPVVLRDGS